VLSAPERTRLEARLAERERATGAQMVIAVFRSLEGESLEDVSIRLAEKWKVGKKGVDNGVILVIFLKDRKLRIEVGYGLESVITDAVSTAIIRDAIAPRFREQRYAAGLEAAVDAVFARVRGGAGTTSAPGTTTFVTTVTAPNAPVPADAPWNPAMILLVTFGLVAILVVIRWPAIRRAFTAGLNDPSLPPTSRGGGGWSGGGWSSSGGGSWSSGGGGGGVSGGGGFSGGGGSFGGGGASGSW
jgi:uncharacterized protein